MRYMPLKKRYNMLEHFKGARRHALTQWERIFHEALEGNINKENLVMAMESLNRIDSEILSSNQISRAEKNSIFEGVNE